MKKIKIMLIDISFFVVGSIVYSIGVLLFLNPNEISPGGLTGIATVLNYLYNLPIGTVVLILNIPLLLVALIKFGGIFIVKTAVVTLIMSVTLDLTEELLNKFKMDLIISSVFGGILMGLGISLVMLRGATTGGVDIIAKLINSKIPHLTVGRLMLLSDSVVILISALIYKNVESALYSVIALYASSKIMDSMLYGADKGKIIYIITDKWEIITKNIISTVKRGVTVIDVVGGYTGQRKKMIMCSVRRNEVSQMYQITKEFDENSFIIIGEAGEILGEGFKSING